MAIEWNTVTWYSKAIAIALYVLTFAIAFSLGVSFQKLAEEGNHKVHSGFENDDRRVPPTSPEDTVCQSDAKLCPDGSSVGRTGVRCEFAECPKNTIHPGDEPATPPGPDEVFCTMDAKMCPDGSAVGRVGPNCEFAPCP